MKVGAAICHRVDVRVFCFLGFFLLFFFCLHFKNLHRHLLKQELDDDDVSAAGSEEEETS